MAAGQGLHFIGHKCRRCIAEDEEEYETFLEILRDAGEAWGNGQAGMGARRATPFHALFVVSEQEKAKRAHWGMKEINTEPTRQRLSSNGPPTADRHVDIDLLIQSG